MEIPVLWHQESQDQICWEEGHLLKQDRSSPQSQLLQVSTLSRLYYQIRWRTLQFAQKLWNPVNYSSVKKNIKCNKYWQIFYIWWHSQHGDWWHDLVCLLAPHVVDGLHHPPTVQDLTPLREGHLVQLGPGVSIRIVVSVLCSKTSMDMCIALC